MNYTFLIEIIYFLLLCSCSADEINEERTNNELDFLSNKISKDSLSTQFKDDYIPEDKLELIHEGNRNNFYIWKIPAELKPFESVLPECNDSMTSCAACGYCAYIKLSDNWSLFAYECDENKWWRNIEIFKNKDGKLIKIQTFKGFVDSVIVNRDNYSLLVADGTLEYFNTDYRFLYEFSGNKFVKGKTISDTTSNEEYKDFLKTIRDENGIYGF